MGGIKRPALGRIDVNVLMDIDRLIHFRDVADLDPNMLNGVYLIGQGYDVFAELVSADGLRLPLFDWRGQAVKKVPWDQNLRIPEIMESATIGRWDISSVTGETIEQYQEKLATKANLGFAIPGLFSSKLSMTFGESSMRDSKFAFTRVDGVLKKWDIKLSPPAATLRNLMKPEVRHELDDVGHDPAKARSFFDRYGTHFLNGIVMGGHIACFTSTNRLEVSHNYSLDMLAEENFNVKVGKGEAGGGGSYSEAVRTFSASSQEHWVVDGGDAAKFRKPSDCAEWETSIQGDKIVLADLTGYVPLVPVWDLARDSGSANSLKDFFFNTYAPEKVAALRWHADFIDRIEVAYGDSSNVHVEGYQRIDVDLNKGADGKYIYLFYHKLPWSRWAVQTGLGGMIVISGKNAQPAPGWQKIDVDLNKGAGGKYLYLCYRNIAYNAATVIKDIVVLVGDNHDIRPPYGYTRVDVDLNSGAGGKYIYCCYCI